MPADVQREFGYALYLAQAGRKHVKAKALKGFGSAGVLEVVASGEGSTFRAVHTVRIAGRVYVLQCFPKKSKRGIAQPKREMDLIRERLKEAAARQEERRGGTEGERTERSTGNAK